MKQKLELISDCFEIDLDIDSLSYDEAVAIINDNYNLAKEIYEDAYSEYMSF